MISVWASAAVIGIPVFGTFTGSMYKVVGTKKIPTGDAYIHNVWWLCGLPAVAFVALLFMNIRPRDRALRQGKGDLRVRLFTHVLRINFAEGVRLLGPKEQDEEFELWAASQGAGGKAAPEVVPVESQAAVEDSAAPAVAAPTTAV